MDYELRRLQLISKNIDNYFLHDKHVKILDIGFARKPNKFLLDNPLYNVTGLDQKKNDSNIHYHSEIAGDATEDLSYLGKFDVIIAGAFIEHIENPYQFLRNMKMIAHDNTLLIISTPNPVGIPTLLFELISSLKYFYNHSHLYYITPRWVQRMLRHSGWKPVKLIGVGAYFIKFWFPVPYTLSYDIIYVSKIN